MSRRRTPGGRAPVPPYKPQLARLVRTPPEGDDWLHEMKYDGYRIGCRIVNGTVRLISRNGNDWTETFPEIVTAARALAVRDALLDGEVAVLLPDGRTSFQALQNAATGRAGSSGSLRARLVYFAFDLLHVAGETLSARPLLERKTELLALVGAPEPRARIRYSEHVVGRGAEFFEQACRLGLEGIVSKRADAPYKAGRSDVWLKTKCVLRQEFVIGGFTDPEGSRDGVGALLVGYYEGDTLRFAGKVGTGFTIAASRDLRRQLEALEQRACPFTPRPSGWLGKHAHWTRPELVGEVVFTEWTGDDRIRHPSFQGLRTDTAPRTVRRETPADVPQAKPGGARSPSTRRVPADPRPLVAGVPISHGERVLYPGTGLTKRRLAEYYERIADWIVPHVKGRPLTLVRCPEGIAGPCFYMKHSKVSAPEPLRRVSIQEKTKVGEYLIADTPQAVVSLVQMGILEIHTWNTRYERVELPDRIVFDIDPGARIAWKQVIAAGRLVRRLLDGAGLPSFPKTTGGRGLHVVVPLRPKADWKECLEFSRRIAVLLEEHDPELYTTAFAKAGRERKILIDYLRNNRTNTSIAAYSTRARAGAPVSTPLRWAELKADVEPARWTVEVVERRLAKLKEDPWRDYWISPPVLKG
ncbi:MAG TPA: DNA ligase D [Vicinamibacterales bacterium]|nr:DNA ligase D [Vicinamibacterales bacterium]